MTCDNCLSEFASHVGGKPQRFCSPHCRITWHTRARKVGNKVILGGRIGRQRQKAGKTIWAFPFQPRRHDERRAFYRAAREMILKEKEQVMTVEEDVPLS